MLTRISRSYNATRFPQSILLGMLLGAALTVAAIMYALH
jgi:hypothetical protein